MQTNISEPELSNPLAELISDDIYNLLNQHGLIDQRSVRDYHIRKKFKRLREQKIKTGDAIESLQSEYPYLQFDTIRKIVHNPPKYSCTA